VCFVVIYVPFCFIVMYVVSLFSMLSYCLVCLYYLSYICFLFCMVAFYFFCSLLLYCMFVLLFFFFFFFFFFLSSVCVFCTCILNTATGWKPNCSYNNNNNNNFPCIHAHCTLHSAVTPYTRWLVLRAILVLIVWYAPHYRT
jgi:hypothetical protein